MTIASAVKEKNRLTGRIKKLQEKIRTYNTYRASELPDLDSKVLLVKLQEEWAYLINLKVAIAKANIGISDKLVALSEAKAELKFWNDMVSYAGKSETTVMRSTSRPNGVIEYSPETTFSTITSMEVLTNIDKVQSSIEILQDEIDIFNGTNII